MSIQLQAPVPLVSLVKTEPLTVIKNEPPEEKLEKEISPDSKNVDIVYHSLSEDLIKKTVPENILETKYSESVETQVFVKTEYPSDENATRGTGQEMIEVQDLNGISTRTRKAKQTEKTNFAKCYKTVETTSWKKDKEKIKVIKAPVIPVEAHEYTCLAKDKYVCNHCQHAYNALSSLRRHIKQMHRKLTTMYQCPYCSYYYKLKWSLKMHIILNHKDTKDIQWFQCNLCEMKFKIKDHLTRHMKVHLKHKKMQDGLDLCEKRYHCNNCDYKTDNYNTLKRHNLVHLKPEEIEYFYCYHCSYKFKRKSYLKNHIFRSHFKNVKQGKRYGCNKCDYETYASTNFNNHKLSHLKPEDIPYFRCYHCSYKSKQKLTLQRHIFKHLKNGEVNFDCYICNFMAQKRESIIEHIKKHSKVQMKFEINERHKLIHLKPEDIPYFHCYHCSYKSKQKVTLQSHIFKHLRNGEVKFDCYLCNFMTQKRESIIEHIKKHSKVQIKFEKNEGS